MHLPVRFDKEISFSLRSILIVALLLCMLIPILLIGSVSYNSIYSLQKDKVVGSINQILKKAKTDISDKINSLDNVAQLMAYDSNQIENLEFLEKNNSIFSRYLVQEKVRSFINLVNYTNSDIGLIFYFNSKTGESITATGNLPVRNDLDITKFPTMIQKNDIFYCGPVSSQAVGREETVFTLVRKVNLSLDTSTFVYIEVKNSVFEKIIDTRRYNMSAIYFIADSEGRIIFTQDGDRFPINTDFNDISGDVSNKSTNGYLVFSETDPAGWQLMVAIDETEFSREMNKWIMQSILVVMVSFIIGLGISLLIWKILDRSIRMFHREIQVVASNSGVSGMKPTPVKDFNFLLVKLRDMRTRIEGLIEELKQKERLKRQLEIEQLLTQINPHFLYNTLDNIRWMARMNKQDDIVNLVLSLNKVLHYNLGKQGEFTTIANEIDMLEGYIAIQHIRYETAFTVSLNVDRTLSQFVIPRFILQPLVENAIQYGKDDHVDIDVKIMRDNQTHLIIMIKDNGRGMDGEMVQGLLREEWYTKKEKKPGIGIKYVISMLRIQYGSDADINIISEQGVGTEYAIRLPIIEPQAQGNDLDLENKEETDEC